MLEEQEDPVKSERLVKYGLWLRQRPVMLGLFLVLAIILFLITSGLARV